MQKNYNGQYGKRNMLTTHKPYCRIVKNKVANVLATLIVKFREDQ